MSKTYYQKDNPTKIVTIVNENDSQDSFYQLSNGQMIKKDVFAKYYELSPSMPVRENPTRMSDNSINPDNFFKPSLVVSQNDIQSLKNTDPSRGALDGVDRTEVLLNTSNKTKNAEPFINEGIRHQNEPPKNEGIVQQVDPTKMIIPNNTKSDVSGYKVYDNDDDAYADFLRQSSQPQAKPQPKPQIPQMDEIESLYEDEKLAYGIPEAEKRKDLRLKKYKQLPMEQSNQPQNNPIGEQQYSQFDSSEMMFRSFKRNHDIEIKVEFNEKISKPEFIKLMMENMEGDIVSFYKKLIVQDIRNNFKVIEDEVEKQLNEHIFGTDSSKKSSPKKSSPKKSVSKKKDVIISSEKISGKVTKSGKQTYKYIDEDGKVKELLPETAEQKNLKPLKK